MNPKTIIAMALTAILTSGAIALAGPIGLSVESQANPVRSFSATGFSGKNLVQKVYTVPQGKVFILSDIHLGAVSPPAPGNSQVSGQVLIDGNAVFCPFHITNGHQANLSSKQIALQNGYSIKAGSTIALTSKHTTNAVLSITGYLARP